MGRGKGKGSRMLNQSSRVPLDTCTYQGLDWVDLNLGRIYPQPSMLDDFSRVWVRSLDFEWWSGLGLMLVM